MPKLTRDQFNRWNAKAQNGFTFDVQKYVAWGDKTLHKVVDLDNGDRMEVRILYTNEYVRKQNFAGQSFNVRTGRFVPAVHLTRWQPSQFGGYMSHGLGDYITIGEPQDKQKYDVLCKLSASVDADKLVSELGKHTETFGGVVVA